MCLLVATAWAITFGSYGLGYCFADGFHIGIGNGQIAAFTESGLFSKQGFVGFFVNPDGRVIIGSVPLESMRAAGPTPDYSGKGFSIDLFYMFQWVGLATAILWWCDLRRRFPLGHCQQCGYNLYGLPEPRCPECGTAFEKQDIPRESTREET